MALNENNRIFWAVQAVGISPDKEENFTEIHGLQSCGITTTFNLEQIFEIGQVAIYENIEDIPDVEVTLEKVIDGYPLIYHLATQGRPTTTLVGRSARKCVVALSIFGEENDSASGTPNTQLNVSGVYTNSVSYTMPVEGSCTEAVTLVGNNKTWRSSSFTFTGTIFDNTDTPLSLTSGTGGVQKRENVIFDVTNLSSPDGTLLPGGVGGVHGISSSGTNNKNADGFHTAHVQQISVSTDFGRDNLFELGTRLPYFRYINFPVEVTTEIEIIAVDGDQVEATEAGVVGDGNNLSAKQIYIKLEEGLVIDLGSNNKLANVSYGGADAGGGNATVTYTYSNFNIMDVTHPQDPG